MALPPAPLEEVLPEAEAVITGRVIEVLHSDPSVPWPHAYKIPPAEAIGPLQVVRLAVDEVLEGKIAPGDELVVLKPGAGFSLAAGHHGPWLLASTSDAEAARDEAPAWRILGAYGPDTYPLEALRAALPPRP